MCKDYEKQINPTIPTPSTTSHRVTAACIYSCFVQELHLLLHSMNLDGCPLSSSNLHIVFSLIYVVT